MPVCFCPKQSIDAIKQQIVNSFAGKHLYGCIEPSSSPEEAECRCFGPERLFFLDSYAEDVAIHRYEEKVASYSQQVQFK